MQSYCQVLAREIGEDEGPCGEMEPHKAEAETSRRHQLIAADIITNLPLAGLLERRLVECRCCSGEEVFSRAMTNVDTEVLQQLQRWAHEAS